MSVSATSSVRPSNPIDSLIPTLPSENAETASTKAAGSTASKAGQLGMFGADDDSPSFWDLVDVINPLQHIPLVNDIYRELSGDKIGIAARLTGGALFGGVIGLVGAAVNSVLEESTGATAGGHVLALFLDDDATGATGTALAQATPPPEKTSDSPDSPDATAKPPPPVATAEAKTDAKTDARPILLNNLIGDEPAAPAAMPRAAVSTSAATAPAGTATQPAEEPAAVTVAATAGADAGPTRLWNGRQARPLTLPSRTTPVATRTPPAVATAISGNSARSPLPVTGARPQSGLIAPANAAPITAAQAEGATKNAASTDPTPPGNDWFTAAMAEGLNKYQKSNARAAESAAP